MHFSPVPPGNRSPQTRLKLCEGNFLHALPTRSSLTRVFQLLRHVQQLSKFLGALENRYRHSQIVNHNAQLRSVREAADRSRGTSDRLLSRFMLISKITSPKARRLMGHFCRTDYLSVTIDRRRGAA